MTRSFNYSRAEVRPRWQFAALLLCVCAATLNSKQLAAQEENNAATAPSSNSLPDTVVKEAAPTTADLLRVARSDWQRLENWFRLSNYYSNWMNLLKRNVLQEQWNRTGNIDPAALKDLEQVYARYSTHVNDSRYNQFQASFNLWKEAVIRENYLRLAETVRRQANNAPQLNNNRPDIYRQRIGSAVRNVQSRLTAFTSQGAADWKRFLLWETLQTLSQGSEPLPLETLQHLQVVMRNGVVVWDVPAMKELQKAIDEAATQAAIASEENFVEARKAKINELANLIALYGDSPTNERRMAIGTPFAWLKARGEIKDLQPTIVRQFSNPNFRYETSAGVIERDVNQNVTESFNVNDVYNGASVSGRGSLTGHVQAFVLPSSNQAVWEMRMDGQTNSSTYAYGSGVGVNSSGNTMVSAFKRVTMDASGMRSQPATANANSSITYNGIDASSYGPYAGVAQSRVMANRGSSESQAERSTENYITQRLNNDGSQYVRKYNQKYQDNFVYPRARQLAWPHQFQMHSSSEYIVMDMLDGPPESLGATTPPPPSPFEADAYVKSHVSSFDAYGWRRLGGKRLTVTELRQIMKDLGMEDTVQAAAAVEAVEAAVEAVDEATKDEAEKSDQPSESIAAIRAARTLSFPTLRPIEFTLQDGLLTANAHLEGFASEGKDYAAMEVKFTYRLTGGDSGMEVVRETLEAWPAGFVPGSGTRLSGPQLVVRKLLVNVLKDALPERAKITHLSGGLGDDLPIKHYANLGEWICIGMNVPRANEQRPTAGKPTKVVQQPGLEGNN